AKSLEVLDCRRAEQVASNSRHHEHVRPTKTGSDRLIRAFTPKSEIEFLAENCFPGLREPIRECCQIDVGTSNHRDARAPSHSFLQRNLKNAESICHPRLCQRRWRYGCARQLFFESDGSHAGIVRLKFSAIVAFLGGRVLCLELCAVP